MTVIRDCAYLARSDGGFRLASGDIVVRDGVIAEIARPNAAPVEGRQVAAGTLEELQAAQLERQGGGSRLSLAPGTDLERAARVLGESGIECHLAPEAPDLEEVFLALTGKALRDGD